MIDGPFPDKPLPLEVIQPKKVIGEKTKFLKEFHDVLPELSTAQGGVSSGPIEISQDLNGVITHIEGLSWQAKPKIQTENGAGDTPQFQMTAKEPGFVWTLESTNDGAFVFRRYTETEFREEKADSFRVGYHVITSPSEGPKSKEAFIYEWDRPNERPMFANYHLPITQASAA